MLFDIVYFIFKSKSFARASLKSWDQWTRHVVHFGRPSSAWVRTLGLLDSILVYNYRLLTRIRQKATCVSVNDFFFFWSSIVSVLLG